MSQKSLEHRAARVSLVTGLSTLLAIGFQLVAVPVCLKYWGKDVYGSWLALFAAFVLVRSLDAGYVAYVGNKLNILYHNDTETLRVHLSSGLAGIALIGILQLALAFGALLSDTLAAALGMPGAESSGVFDRMGLIVMLISWVLTGSYLGIVHRLQIPAGMMYQSAWWSMLFQVSQFVAIMSAALLKLNLLQTSTLFALSQFAIYITSANYVKQKLPGFYPWWEGARLSVGLQDLKQSLLLTVSNLIQQASTNGVVLLIAALAGPAAVPVFATIRTISNLWTNVTNVLTTPLLPDMVRFHATGETHKLVSLNQAFWVLVGSAVNWGVLLTYPLLAPLYGYWTGHILVLDKALLCLLLGSVVVTNAGALMAMHLNGINSLRIVLATSVVRGVLGLGIGTLTYGQLGLAGFGLGILAGELVVLLMVARFFVLKELVNKGAGLRVAATYPALLGMVSVLAFLLAIGFDMMPLRWAWPMGMAGVIGSTVWGWARLKPVVRARLIGFFANRFVTRGNQ